MLYRTFEISTRKTKDSIFESIREIYEEDFKLFPKKILTGTITKNHKLNAVINVPFPMSDPFKNRVAATIVDNRNRNVLKGKVQFGILNTILCFFFYIPYLFNIGEGFDIKIFGMLTLMNLSIICLLYLKLMWDSNRLKRKLIEIL